MKQQWAGEPGIGANFMQVCTGAEAFVLADTTLVYASALKRRQRSLDIVTREGARRSGKRYGYRCFKFAVEAILMKDAGCDYVVLDVKNPEPMFQIVKRLLEESKQVVCHTKIKKTVSGVWLLQRRVDAPSDVDQHCLEDIVIEPADSVMAEEDLVMAEASAALASSVQEIRGEN
eukprot:SAG11_NODE_7208_length_1176_cov_6.217069_1_plen_174_part_10